MPTCFVPPRNSIGRFSNVSLALNVPFKSRASLLTGWERESRVAKAGKKLHQWLTAAGESGSAGESAEPLAPLAYSSHIQACAGRENSQL